MARFITGIVSDDASRGKPDYLFDATTQTYSKNLGSSVCDGTFRCAARTAALRI
jgi:hypothetical protein